MQGNQLLNNVILLVRGSPLPTKDEIEQMPFEEKLKLEMEQDQIIQIFRQQALLDIWQLKAKTAKLLKETSELRIQMIRNKENSEIKQKELVNIKNKPVKLEERKLSIKKGEKSIKKTEKLQTKSSLKLKNENISAQNDEVDFSPKNTRPNIRINSQLPNKTIDDQSPKDNVKSLKSNKKSKVRNLVKKNPRLDTFNLRIKNKRDMQRENNIPKYPFSVEQTNNESNKYSYLVSSLSPKNLLLAEIQSKKESSQDSQKNNEKNLTKSKYQFRNKNEDNNQSIISNAIDHQDENLSKKTKRKPTPRKQSKKHIDSDKNYTNISKNRNMK